MWRHAMEIGANVIQNQVLLLFLLKRDFGASTWNFDIICTLNMQRLDNDASNVAA